MTEETPIQTDTEQAQKPRAVVYCPNQEFLHPYFERELADHDISFSLDVAEKPDLALMVSSADIYGKTEGENYDETTETDPSSPYHAAEQAYASFCREHGTVCTIVRGANIVGTGMNGFPMELARGIARGTLMHIAGNEARLSVVHAVDVARFGRLLADSGETVNLTDGTATTIDSLMEALAYRLDNKRVCTIKPKWARLLYGKKRLARLTTTLTFSNAKALRLTGNAETTRVTDYLTTHVYDHDSL